MACGLGFPAEQCAEDHWCRVLVGGKVGQHYRFRCPVCGKPDCLEVTVKPSGIIYRCWYDPTRGKSRRPGCPTEAIRAELADLLPCWKGRKPRRRAIDPDELAAILLDKSLPPNALRIAGLRALGVPEAQIRAKLKIPERTYYDALRILAGKRWSAGLRILALPTRLIGTANSRGKIQVRESGRLV